MQQNATLAKAKPLGLLNGPRTIKNALGAKEKNDYYQFSLSSHSTFAVQLDRLKANADLQLIGSDRRVIGISKRSGKKAESITRTLEAGTYYLRVARRNGETQYRLKLNAAEVSLPQPLPVPGIEGYLSTGNQEFGKFNKQSGTFTLLNNANPTFLDIAQSPTGDLFGVTFSKLYQINPTSGATTFVSDLDKTNLNALGFSSTGVLYAAGGSNVYTINPSAGTTTLVANIPGFNSSGDLAFDSTRNQIFATSQALGSSSDTLFSIGLDGSATSIGNIGFRNVYGLSFDNNVLYGYTLDRQQITINPTTGVGSLNLTITGTANPIYGAT